MKKRNARYWRGLGGIASILVVLMGPLGLSFPGWAQSIIQSETPTKSSETAIVNAVPPVEITEPPILSYGKVVLSPATVQSSLRNFLARLSILAKTSEKHWGEEYETLYDTLLPFLASEQFARVVVEAQKRREPIELTLVAPRRLRESKMIQEFSERFHLPLDYEPNQEIIPSTVTISLSAPWIGIPIKIESQNRETVYLVESDQGNILKRFQR